MPRVFGNFVTKYPFYDHQKLNAQYNQFEFETIVYGVIQRFGAVASNSIARMSRSKSRIDVSFEAGRIISPQPLCQFDRRELWDYFLFHTNTCQYNIFKDCKSK